MKNPSTLQEIFNAVQNGTGRKDVFLKEAKRLYSGLITNAATFDQTVKIFKSKNILNENYIDLKPLNTYEDTREKESWEDKYAAFLSNKTIISESKKPTESNISKLDKQIGQEVINGLAFEASENPDKTIDELRGIVSKNLDKDQLYYAKNAMFGTKGVGLTDEIPGLKASKSDQMEKVKIKSLNEVKSFKMDDKLKEIHKQGDINTLEAKINAIEEEINTRNERINMIDENEDLAELVNPAKVRELQKEVKVLEKQKQKLQKIYEKLTGKNKKQVIDEPQEVEEPTDENLEPEMEDESLNESTEEPESNDFEDLVHSFKDYIDSVSREEMFDQEGNYNSTLKGFHDKLQKYAETGDEKQKTVATFILNWI